MKNAIIAILGIAVIGLAAVLFLSGKPSKVGPETNHELAETKTAVSEPSREPPPSPETWTAFTEIVTNAIDAGKGDVVEITTTGEKNSKGETRNVKKTEKVLKKKRSLTRKPLEPEATKRLADGPQTIEIVFEGTGRGSWKKLGVEVSGRYFFTSIVKAVSTVDAVKEETARGNFEVTEIRKFVQVQDHLTVDDTDVALALEETLPLDAISATVKGIGMILDFFVPGVGEEVGVMTDVARESVKMVDGTSVRGLLGAFGVDIPADVEDYIKTASTEFCNGQLENVHNKIQSIQGKSYKIVYVQNAEGAPLTVDFTNVDSSPIAEDEWDILKLANVFLDAQIIPDKRVQPGDTWNIEAEVIAGLVDAVAQGGTCEGQITVERKDNLDNGDWELCFHPAQIRTRADGGATTGDFKIAAGNAIGDKENAYVKSMQVAGTGRLGKTKSERYAIFDFMTKISGNCEYRALMSTDRKK